MKNNPIAILAGLTLLAVTVGDCRPVLAASPGSPAASAVQDQPIAKPLRGKARRMQMLVTQLGLSDDQTSQVKSILTDEENKARSIKTSADLSPDEKRTQTEALRKATRQQLNAVLTPAQRQKLRQIQRDRLASAGAPATPPSAPTSAPAANP